MARFEIQQSGKLQLTSYSGLALVGQCCQIAQVDAVIDPRIPVSQGMRTADLVKSLVGLLSLGKSDFEAIEPFRQDRFFKQALGLSKIPGECLAAATTGQQGRSDPGYGERTGGAAAGTGSGTDHSPPGVRLLRY